MFGRRKPSANIQHGLKNIVTFLLTKQCIFIYQMDSGKMNEFCNGDGMTDFMSVLLPLCKLLGSEFNWIKQKKGGRGRTELLRKNKYFKELVWFYLQRSVSVSLSLNSRALR